jgi:hypothetical protein
MKRSLSQRDEVYCHTDLKGVLFLIDTVRTILRSDERLNRTSARLFFFCGSAAGSPGVEERDVVFYMS